MSRSTFPEGVVLEHSPCPLGCPPSDTLVLRGGDRLHGIPGEFRVVRCIHCSLMRTDPRPTADSIGAYYPDDYGPYLGTRVQPEGNGQKAASWRSRIHRLFETHAERLPPLDSPGRMLEIGCASGAFMHRMSRLGWDVEGIEFSPVAGGAARQLGFTVHIGSVENAPDPDQPYDLAVGWMVLEHLHEPVQVLRKLHRWTRAGGWLAFSVPNAASQEFRLFRDRWYALQLPTHLYHYTPGSLRRLLHASGWQLERLVYQRNLTNPIVSTGYLLEDLGYRGNLTQRLLRFPEASGRWNYYLHPLAVLLGLIGQTGRMTGWARRIDD